MKVQAKSEQRMVRAVTRTNLGSGKVTKFVDEVREERYRQWSGRRIVTRAVFLYLALAGVVGISQFVLMESVKNPSFSLGTCQTLLKTVSDNESRATVIGSCEQAFDYQQMQADWAARTNGLIGWVNPLSYGIFGSFFQANQQNLRFEKVLFEVAVNADVKPYVASVKNQTAWSYQYVVFSTSESDVAGLNSMIQHEASLGFHIKTSYDTKINGTWCVVVVFERVCQTGTCPTATE